MAKLRPALFLAAAALASACSSSPKKLPNAAYYMGETYLRRGQLDQAVQAYQVFITDPGPTPDLYLPRAYYMLAFAYCRQGRFEDASRTLDEMEKRYPEIDSVQVWTLRGDISKELGNKVEALQEWDEAWRFANQLDRVRLETRISSTLNQMDVEELSRAEQVVSDPVVHALVAKRLTDSGGSLIAAEDQAAAADSEAALAAAPTGDDAILRSHERREAHEAALEQRQARHRAAVEGGSTAPAPLEVPPPAAAAEQAAAAEPVMAEPPPGPGKVVCLAPLSGPEGTTGARVCNSVTSAWGEASERVVTQDAGETSNAARAAWMTAIDDPSVVAAVTWLPRDSTQAIAPMAETAGLPTILLAPAGGTQGRYVREWGPGRTAEVNGLANYMVNTVRVRRFGVFYPDTGAGNDYLDRFTAAVRANEGEIVGKQVYRTGDLDERPLLDTLKKWRRRDVNVDAVFVPDQVANVEELVAEINRDYPDVIVLGLSSWSGTTMQLQAFIASGTDTAAFDAASALYGAVVGGGANTRPEVAQRLRDVIDGASTASTAAPTIYRLKNGTTEAVGG